MKNDKVYRASDITDIKLVGAEYHWESGYFESEYSCRINNTESHLILTEYRHDDSVGITIHTSPEDIYGKMSVSDILILEGKLQEAFQYGNYHNAIEKAKTIEDIEEISFDFLETEDSHLRQVLGKLWVELQDKRNQLELKPA